MSMSFPSIISNEPPPLESSSEEEDSEGFGAGGLKLDLQTSAEASPFSTPRKEPKSNLESSPLSEESLPEAVQNGHLTPTKEDQDDNLDDEDFDDFQDATQTEIQDVTVENDELAKSEEDEEAVEEILSNCDASQEDEIEAVLDNNDEDFQEFSSPSSLHNVETTETPEIENFKHVNEPEEEEDDDFGDFSSNCNFQSTNNTKDIQEAEASTTTIKSLKSEEEDNDFADFQDFKEASSSVPSSSSINNFQQQAPRMSADFTAALESKFDSLIKTMIPKVEEAELENHNFGVLEKELTESKDSLWKHTLDFEDSRALLHKWLNSSYQQKFYSSLNIDTTTIVYTEKWGAIEVPRFAASMVETPILQPTTLNTKPVSKEAEQILLRIPDLSYMTSKTLSFPQATSSASTTSFF